jgi:hypothetical protein
MAAVVAMTLLLELALAVMIDLHRGYEPTDRPARAVDRSSRDLRVSGDRTTAPRAARCNVTLVKVCGRVVYDLG